MPYKPTIATRNKPPRNMRQLNRAIEHTGLEIIKGHGYFYFLNNGTGDQVGESLYVYALRQQCLEKWILDAEHHAKEHAEEMRDQIDHFLEEEDNAIE